MGLVSKMSVQARSLSGGSDFAWIGACGVKVHGHSERERYILHDTTPSF